MNPRKNKLTHAILFVALPFAFWMGAVSSRAFVIKPYCASPATAASACTKDSLLGIDQLSIGMEIGDADGYSFFTQNFSGTLAILFPLIWAFGLLIQKRQTAKQALQSATDEVLLVLQAIAWNGSFTELAHLVTHRPRPFVYVDPLVRGLDPAHYTSFYSGHTSFVAATQTIILFLLISKKVRATYVWLWFTLGQGLVIATAYFRILAGRHFLTDVICGAIAGSLVAWFVARSRLTFDDQKLESLMGNYR